MSDITLAQTQMTTSVVSWYQIDLWMRQNIEVVFLLVEYREVFLIQRFKRCFSAEGDDCPDVVDGLCSNLCLQIVETFSYR